MALEVGSFDGFGRDFRGGTELGDLGLGEGRDDSLASGFCSWVDGGAFLENWNASGLSKVYAQGMFPIL